MIKHTKLTKSNIPALLKPKCKKISKKILSSCGTPRKIFSKSTSRNGSPFPSSKSSKRLTISKIKTSNNSTRIKMEILNSYASPNSSSTRSKKFQKSKTSKALSGNLSEKDTFELPLASPAKESIHIKDKLSKFRSENEKQMKTMLQKLLHENVLLKNKLNYVNENQEEPKSTMSSYSIEAAMEEIKQKLRNLKKRFV